MRTAETTPEPSPAAPSAWSAAELAGNPHEHAEKAEKVRRMFAAIAKRYDLNNRLHSFGRDQAWRRRAVCIAEVKPGEEVLDAACGTGDLARAFADAGAARVVGLDFTPEMLAIARQKESRGGGRRRPVEYVEGDAMALPFSDGSFDVVSIAFGIRNVADPARALREFRRVLRPSGRLVVLEFSRPRGRLLRSVHDWYTNVVMPRTASWIAGDRSGAYRYLPRSVRTFLDPGSLTRAVLDVGFSCVSATPMTFGVCVCYRANV